MSYPEFREQIFCTLKELTPKNVCIEMCCTAKLNNSTRYGISFQAQDSDICPTIYLEPFYKAFERGICIEQLAEEMLSCYREEAVEMPECIQYLECFESARANIYIKLIHTEENAALLEDTPHISFLDFSVVCYFEVINDKNFKGSVLLKKEHVMYWNVTQEELFSCAAANTKQKKQVYFCPIIEMLDSYMQEGKQAFSEPTQKGMFVLTNHEKYLGAVMICFLEVQRMIFQKVQENYYLLPSSVHEWIIVPQSYAPDMKKMLSMIYEINETEVMPEEVLSYNLYYFEAASQKIHIYESGKYKNS